MPQPLSRVAANVSIMVGNAGDRPLSRHPDLAILAIEAIASWSNVELFMLDMYVQLMGGLNDRAATAYLALETQSAKTQVIRAVAQQVLSKKDFDLLVAILAIAKTRQKFRDRLAHHTWGECPQIHDALLLIDPKSLLALPIDMDRVYVYKRADFEEIISANDRLCGYGGTFRQIIGDTLKHKDFLYELLYAAPEVREKLGLQA
ncbi:hypothetical protein JQK88_10405 [Mesorhizobium caraganae]|uniref:hypothetical protein n=1 Tax=Mesorhizobium caraganae TaxID=483206 RepID=UPI00193A62E4|nr:hypothetical protein [Mesorhizobium caraganae]MBM2711658.1 hypothetical protein [Mesorhizobium caraganae]